MQSSKVMFSGGKPLRFSVMPIVGGWPAGVNAQPPCVRLSSSPWFR